MNSTEIRSILRSPYNRENWKNLYRNIFQNKVTFHEEPYQYNVNEDIVESLFQIGYATLDDEYIVALFEVNIKSGINLLSKKIGLRKIISKYISDDKFNGVLTIFENGSPDYRFTFASKTTKITEEGIQVFETESKRFTYILGSNEPCLTPTQRFESLFKKNGNINLEDIKDAFSVEKLNKEFFNGYKDHYELLCNYFYSIPLKKKIFNNDDKLIRDFVKKFLGRIVFLYFVQKKGWLGVKKGESWGSGDNLFLSNLFKSYKNKNQFYSKVLSKIFFDYLSIERKVDIVKLYENKVFRIPYLNGGLFEKEDVDEFEINFEDSFLESLFSFFDRFNFTIYEDDPNEHTVAVDPEMLGHIFENLLEDNKDKGAFYTPKEIVHYMCQESLIEYLTTWFENKGYEIIGYSSFDKPEQPLLFSENDGRKGQLVLENNLNKESKKINKFLIENLLKKRLSDSDKNLILVHSREFHEALDKVKICDPAIGSGAFPMGLLQEIFISKQTLWNFEHGNMEKFPASDIKLNIIQNSIYGVDIEKGAVEIARLRFWLSLIVDEEEPHPLPNLDYKIVVGNSLLNKFNDTVIDIDWSLNGNSNDLFGSQLTSLKVDIINNLIKKQKLYFKSDNDKKILQNQIRNIKIDLIINQLNLMISSRGIENAATLMTKKKKEYSRIYDLTKSWKHSIIELEKLKNDSHKELKFFDWKLNFPEILSNNIDSQNGFDIVIGNPPYVQIKQIPETDKIHFTEKYKFSTGRFNLFYFFLELTNTLTKKNTGLASLIIPDRILLNTQCFEIRNWLLNDNTLIEISSFDESVFESAVVDTIILIFKNIINTTTHLFSRPSLKIYELETKSKEIIPFSYFRKSRNNQFDLNHSDSKSLILNKITNNTIQLGEISETRDGIIQSKIPDVLFLKEKSNADCKKILFGKNINKYKLEFADNWVNYNHKKMMEIELSRNGGGLRLRKPEIFERNKILTRQTSDCIIGCIDIENYYYANTIHGTTITDHKFNIKFILAILNSKVINYYYRSTTSEGGKVFAQIKIELLRMIPIKYTIKQDNFIKRVQIIEDYVKKGIDFTEIENELDILIYKLYELNYNEVKAIDPDFFLSEKEYINLNFD